MGDWSHGYVSDIGYTFGYYREQSPALLDYALLTAGVKPPERHARTAYCEMGCGRGLTSLVMAATNPGIEFVANDFNPGHIAGAQSLARQAGLNNIDYRERSFEEMNREQTPQFDYIGLRGIMSWISAENRAHIVKFIRERLKPGGAVYVCYNALPGWAAVDPLRQLVLQHSQHNQGPTDKRIREALGFADSVRHHQSAHFRMDRRISEHLERMKTEDVHYVAHEYFNQDWDSFYFSQMADIMSGAKLNFVASAQMSHQYDHAFLSEEQRSFLSKIPDPVLRQTVRDYLLNTDVRRDIFVKGPEALSDAECVTAIMATPFALTYPPQKVELSQVAPVGEIINFPTQHVDLDENLHTAVVEVLKEGPRTAAEISQSLKLARFHTPAIREALAVLTSMEVIAPLPRDYDYARVKPDATKFNELSLARAGGPRNLGHLISPIAGTGIPLATQEQLLLAMQQAGISLSVENMQEFVGARQRSLGGTADDVLPTQGRIDEFESVFQPWLACLGVQ